MSLQQKVRISPGQKVVDLIVCRKSSHRQSHDRAEIADYAQWLGLDLDAEKELVWICREGLKAKLPAEWKAL